MYRKILFYRKEDQECPVEKFLDSVSEGLQVKIIAVFKLIETQNVVPGKFLKKLERTKLFEVRVEWQSNIYRFPCFFEKDKIVILTHGFQKKTMKTPRREIERAENYRQDYLRRQK